MTEELTNASSGATVDALGITGMTQGFGMQMGSDNYYRGVKIDSILRPKWS